MTWHEALVYAAVVWACWMAIEFATVLRYCAVHKGAIDVLGPKEFWRRHGATVKAKAILNTALIICVCIVVYNF